MKLTHAQFDATLPLWQKVRDVMSEEAVKDRGDVYLPRLASMSVGTPEANSDYNNYRLRANVFMAAPRTLEGLKGSVLRKDPTIDGVPDIDLPALRDQVGQAFEPLLQIGQQVLHDLVSVGRVGLLVDSGLEPESLPYIATVPPERIAYWSSTTVGGREVPTLYVLLESWTKAKDGDMTGAEAEEKPQWRFLRLGDPSQFPHLSDKLGLFSGAPLPVYWQEVWREPETKGPTAGSMELADVIVPRKAGGRFWSEIPFDIANASCGIGLAVENPPMLGLANVVLAHYRNSADLEWGRHMCAIPQPWASGFHTKEGEELIVGSGRAWVTDVPGGSVNYLEFSGAGLGNIQQGMADKEQQMAVLGARMLEQPKAGTEAMGTVKLRQAGERSVLGTIAGSAGTAMTRAIQRWLSWRSPAFETDEAQAAVSFCYSSDFDAMPLDPAEQQALMAQLQAGLISWDTYAWNMQRGEVLPPGVTVDQERELIQAGAPGRSRKDELQMLQNDVAAGRISTETYLQQAQALGYYGGVDVAAELAKVEEQRMQSVIRQAEAFAARGGFGGDPSGAAP